MGGIQNLHQGRRGIAAIIAAELIDLIEHEERVSHPGAAYRPNDAPGHGADIGAPVAAQLGLVVQAAQGQALELPIQGPADRLAQGGLAHTRRPHEAENRRARLGIELHDRQDAR